jgi:hypothetical protein
MVRVLPTVVFSLVLAARLAATSAAVASDGTQPEAMIVLHAVEHVYPPPHGSPCVVGKPAVPCREYRVTWPVGSSADVYLVAARGYPDPGIAALSCGIEYDPQPQRGVDMFGWTLCADMEFTNAGAHGEWPASGGGNRIVWSALDACQRTVIHPDGVHAIAGAFYVYAYSPDRFCVTSNANILGGPELAVADCSAQVTYISTYMMFDACIGFGGVSVDNPCKWTVPIPVDRTTWGGIKTKY